MFRRFRFVLCIGVFNIMLIVSGCDKPSTSTMSASTTSGFVASIERSAVSVTTATPASGVTSRVAGAPTAILDFGAARKSAKGTEAGLAAVPLSHTVGPRGFGEVLTVGLIPKKILACDPKAMIRDDHGTPKMPLKSSLPYFVFDEESDRVKVGPLQDYGLAQGWVNVTDCFPWPNRRLCYPKLSGDVAVTLVSPSGDSTTYSGILPDFDPTSQMPWPILAEESGELFALADFRPLGGPAAVPIRISQPDNFDVYVLFSQREIDHALENLTRLAGLLPKMPVTDVPRVFGAFLTQCECDFVDLSELSSTLERFPGRSPDFLMKKALGERLKNVELALGRQIERLLKLGSATRQFNPASLQYVIPADSLL